MGASSSTKRTLRRDAAGSMGGQYSVPPEERSTDGLAPAALQLEQVVQLGQHQEEAQLLVRAAQADGEPPLGRLALNQHQRTEPRAVHRPRRREVDHEPPRAFRQLVQQLASGPAETG